MGEPTTSSGTGADGPRPRTAGTGAAAAVLAVAALAVGVLACAFSWMFFIAGYVIGGGVVAAALGVAGVLVARRGRRSPTLAAAGAVLGVLAIVAVLTTEIVVRNYLADRLGGLLSDLDPPAAATPAEPADEPAPPVPPPAGVPGAAGGTSPPPAGDLAPNNSSDPVPVGAAGELPSFSVTVTDVLTDAAETLEGGGSPPPVNGRYLLVDLTATYTGADAGSVGPPFLTVGLAGGDGLEYREEGCAAVVDEPAFAVAPLSTGESGSWQACIDAPPGALEGASLFVSQLGASAEDRVYWQLG